MCAAGLGIPASSAVQTINVLGQPLEQAGLWPAFERAVDDVARMLDEQEPRVEYARRRRTMATWRLSRGTWVELCAGIPGLEQRGATGDLNVGEALIWSWVNEASYLHSPAVTVRRSAPASTSEAFPGLTTTPMPPRPLFLAGISRRVPKRQPLPRADGERPTICARGGFDRLSALLG